MFNFIDSIKKGIKAAEDKQANLKEIREIITDANNQINDFCGLEHGFIRISNGCFSPNEIITSIEHDANYGYPFRIVALGRSHICRNSIELEDSIKEIISTSAFGSKIRRFKK